MQILLNGEVRELTEGCTLGELLASLDLSQQRFAVEINEALVPRSEHAGHRLQADDRVEIVQAIGGG
jgi:sulfur carrier protein